MVELEGSPAAAAAAGILAAAAAGILAAAAVGTLVAAAAVDNLAGRNCVWVRHNEMQNTAY